MLPSVSVLLTDSYQLSMMQGYFEAGMTRTAVFELFVRRLPTRRNFLVAAGVEQLLDYLESLRFTTEEIKWLRATGRYRSEFMDYLATFRFEGDVDAIDEGTIFFPDEPIVRVTAPLPQAQLVESRLINIIHFQTIIASKAIRTYIVAPKSLLVDFGMRRAHGSEAALFAARASYIGGYTGTSTVLAGELYGIPVYGTMAHSFIQAHPSEVEAFETFARSQMGPLTLLIDTYNTETAAEKVAQLAPKLLKQGTPVQSVRLDSGDLADHARKVRTILDRSGLQSIRIFVSGNLDEDHIHELLSSGAPIDGFGVGTKMITSADAPYLDCAFKIQEYDGVPKRKRSEGKATWPGRKQVYRFRSQEGCFLYDEIHLADESSSGIPLLKPIMKHGKRLSPPTPLKDIQSRTLSSLDSLAPELRNLEPAIHPYRVDVSNALKALAKKLDQEAY